MLIVSTLGQHNMTVYVYMSHHISMPYILSAWGEFGAILMDGHKLGGSFFWVVELLEP